jgi:hypothetical protein
VGYDQQLLPGEFIIKKCLKFLPRNSRESWRDIVLKIFLPYVFCLSKRWLETSPNVIFTWCQIEGRGGLRRTTNYSVKRRLTYCLCGRLLHLAAITLIHSLRHLKKFTKFWSWIFLNLFHPKKNASKCPYFAVSTLYYKFNIMHRKCSYQFWANVLTIFIVLSTDVTVWLSPSVKQVTKDRVLYSALLHETGY